MCSFVLLPAALDIFSEVFTHLFGGVLFLSLSLFNLLNISVLLIPYFRFHFIKLHFMLSIPYGDLAFEKDEVLALIL